MDAIDELIEHHDADHHKWNSMTDFSCQARAQLAQLRARAAERDELKLRADMFDAACVKALNERDALRATVAAQAQMIETARKVITQLAPNEPMNQDEMGGCVWCGGHPRGKPYGYATNNPKHHSQDCAWIIARAWLAANAPMPTQGETLCDVCRERPAEVERDGHKFCGYCYGSYAALTHGEEFATMPQGETDGEA